MSSSLPDKLFDGQTGFPTPNAAPDETGCRIFIVPDSEEWFALLMGAVLRLTQEWAWYKNGTMTQAEAAAAWQAIIDDSYARSLIDICSTSVPTPYWDEDSADDSDDEMSVEDQIWYGEIVALPMLLAAEDTPSLTFLDNVGIFAIAGFIAYAGLPGAAIAFVPVARKFVLYFKQSPTGAIVNILADFLHIADIDTYGVEDGVAKILVTMPDDATTLYVEQASESNPDAGDNPGMTVIRSRLSPSDFANPAYRTNPDTGAFEYSPDGGTTWNPAPGSDPRNAPQFRLPARTGSDVKCKSAANAEAWIQGVIEQCITILGTGAIVVALVNKILEFAEVIFAEVGGELLNLILSVAGAFFDIGSAALLAAFTDDQWPLLLCALYCNMGADGQLNDTQFAGLQSQITSTMNTTAAIVVNLFLSIQGKVGVSNAGAQGTATADCSACTSCFTGYVWDFRISDGGFLFDSEAASTPGVYVGGGTNGYEKSATGLPDPPYDAGRKSVTFDIPSTCHITTITTTQDSSDGGLDDHLECYIGTSRTAGLAQMPHLYTGSNGTTETASGDISNQTGVHLTWEFANNSGGGDWYTIRIDWTGDEPTGLSGGTFV